MAPPAKAVNPPSTLPADFFDKQQSGPPSTLPADFNFGDDTTSAPPQEKPGFLSSLGKSFGLIPENPEAEAEDIKAHPIRHAFESLPGVAPIEGLLSGAKRSGGELLHGIKDASEGNPSGLLSHGISAIPILGPTMDRASEQAPASTPGESYLDRIKDVATDPGAMGTLVGGASQAAPLVLGGIDTATPGRGLLGQLPSRARAGATLEEIRNQAANVPVNPANTLPEIQRWQQLTSAGGKNSKPLTQLGKRLMPTTGQPQPMMFPEARDFYSNVSDVTRQSPLQTLMGRGLKPTMLRQAGNIKGAFNSDLTDAASQIGRGEDYAGAMKEYANASKLRKLGLIGAGAAGAEVARRTGLLGKVASKVVGQ